MVVQYGKRSKNMWMAERAQQTLGTAAGAKYFARQEQKRRYKIRNVKSTIDMGSAPRRKRGAQRRKRSDPMKESPVKLPPIDPHGPMAPPRQSPSMQELKRENDLAGDRTQRVSEDFTQSKTASNHELLGSNRDAYDFDFTFASKAHAAAGKRLGGITYEEYRSQQEIDVRGGASKNAERLNNEDRIFDEAITRMSLNRGSNQNFSGFTSRSSNEMQKSEDSDGENEDHNDALTEYFHELQDTALDGESEYVPKYGMNKASIKQSKPATFIAHDDNEQISSKLDTIRRNFEELRTKEAEQFRSQNAKQRLRPTQSPPEEHRWEPSLNAREHAAFTKQDNHRETKIPRPRRRYEYSGKFPEPTPGYSAVVARAASSLSPPRHIEQRGSKREVGSEKRANAIRRRKRERAKVRQEVRDAVQASGWDLIHAPEGLRDDREIVILAVRNVGQALHCASKALQDDREVVLTALSNDATALQYASTRMQNDYEVVRYAVSQSGSALQYASAELRSDREVVLAAIDNDLRAFRFADTDLRSDEQMKEAMRGLLRGASFDHSIDNNEEGNKTTDISDFNKAACTLVNHDTAAARNVESDAWLSIRAARLRLKLKEAVSDIDVDPNQDDDLASVGYEGKGHGNPSPARTIADSYIANWAAENSTKVLSFGKDAAGVSMNKSLYHLQGRRCSLEENDDSADEDAYTKEYQHNDGEGTDASEDGEGEDDQEGIDWHPQQPLTTKVTYDLYST